MTVVSRRDIGIPFRGLLRQARIAFIGLGYSVLVVAAGLALWGWLIAEPSQFEGRWDPNDWVHEYAWRKNFPAGPAVSVVIVAAVLIGVSAYAWSRRSRASDHAIRALATLAVLYFAAISFGLRPFYHLVMQNYPVTPAVPLVVVAWLLALVGVVALLVAAPFAELTRKAVPVVVGGVVVGVVAALVPAVRAVSAGDDRHYVDATVAPTVDVPAQPTALGQRRFSVKVSDWRGNRASTPDVQVAPAGAGFVVFHKGQVTGYGSNGKERWHYRRTGPGQVSVFGLRVFDEGRTVVAAVHAGPTGAAGVLVGLDAVTGRELWSRQWTLENSDESAFSPGWNRHGIGDYESSPSLIAKRSVNKSAWTRIDTRTGKPMWTVDAPWSNDCWGRVADTQSQIATATACSGGGKVKIGVVVQDPTSGQQVWQTTFSNAIPDRPDNRLDLRVTPVGLEGVVVTYGAADAPTTRTYVNVVSHVVLDLGPHDSAEASPEQGDVFVVEHSHQPTGADFGLYGMDGLQRCALTPGLRLRNDLVGDYALYLPLANDIVAYDSDGPTFRTFDKYTCAALATQPASSAVDWLATAPGVILVERIETDGTYVDGYA
jgi:hypothetical protein